MRNIFNWLTVLIIVILLISFSIGALNEIFYACNYIHVICICVYIQCNVHAYNVYVHAYTYMCMHVICIHTCNMYSVITYM